MKFFLLLLKNIGRNPIRTLLTALGTMMLVLVVTLVWSILAFLDLTTAEKSKNLKAIITERWKIPSQMPESYIRPLSEGAARKPGDLKPDDFCTWSFYGGTLDPEKVTRESIIFAVAMEPEKIMTMLDDLDELSPDKAVTFRKVVEALKNNKRGIIVGRQQLATMKRRVGERFTITSLNYKGIDLEFEVVGTFPEGRYDSTAIMNRAYLTDALDAYARIPGNGTHPLADKSLNLVWLRMRDMQSFRRIADQIENSPSFSNPAVKIETASSGISSFLEAFSDLLWGMRWLLAPAAIGTLSLVIANAISISVRERRREFAVLKVLGFQPYQILLLVIGEAIFIGGFSGFLSAGLTYFVVNNVMGGLKFPIAFFDSFYIPWQAMIWGAGIGCGTALAGSFFPAWTARSVRVAEVFSQVT